MEKTVVGIDVGGTNSPFGFVDENGKIIAKGTIRTDFFAEFEEYLKALLLEIELKKLENNVEISGFGIGAPNGNYYHGSIENAPNLRWKGIINFTQMVTEKTELPAYLTNDANAAAIGEKGIRQCKRHE